MPKTPVGYLKKNILTLLPSYFALVMATGIVSMAADIFELTFFEKALFYFNIAAYGVLLIMLGLRIIFYIPRVKRDLFDSSRSFGFLTLVAATAILGQQFIVFEENYAVAKILFYVAFFLWVVLIYLLFTIIAINKEKLSLGKGMNAIWLLIVVATAAVSILGTDLANHLPISKEVVLFTSLLLFLVGCLMYVILITLIFYRLAFFPLHAAQFAPAYWINMGAVAILTLAGADLLKQGYSWGFLASIKHFITGFVLLFWAMGTWWIPLIIILGGWRILKKVKPISYQAQYWGMVFPLGMYTVSTYRLSQASNIDFLVNIPKVFVYFAVLAWVITFLGLLLNILYGFFGKYLPKKIPH
ncbi:MAG TPA: tellurite resistance/C4-dicarboxylate transporter family protein [Flavobacteriaceae bacterium]|nr:tellurite resistance/C4-dicarboxylate transporter family protein [Flavobacteriaceae bacterium]